MSLCCHICHQLEKWQHISQKRAVHVVVFYWLIYFAVKTSDTPQQTFPPVTTWICVSAMLSSLWPHEQLQAAREHSYRCSSNILAEEQSAGVTQNLQTTDGWSEQFLHLSDSNAPSKLRNVVSLLRWPAHIPIVWSSAGTGTTNFPKALSCCCRRKTSDVPAPPHGTHSIG